MEIVDVAPLASVSGVSNDVTAGSSISGGSGVAPAEIVKSSATAVNVPALGTAVDAKPRSWFMSALAVIAALALVGPIFLWNQMYCW